MNIARYLQLEIRRYFRDAESITVRFSRKNETTRVTVINPYGPNTHTIVLLCEAGSDDDYFIFNAVTSSGKMTLTVPFSEDLT